MELYYVVFWIKVIVGIKIWIILFGFGCFYVIVELLCGELGVGE